MNHIINGRKAGSRRVGVLCALLLLLSAFALPVNASPPQELSLTFDVIYFDLPTNVGLGSWSSAGLFAGAGDILETYHYSGWDGCWRAVHTTSVLTGATPEDTITVRMQVVRVDAEPGCARFAAEGNWVILSGTGAYAGLRGQGQATISGGTQPGQSGWDLVVHSELQGSGHFQ